MLTEYDNAPGVAIEQSATRRHLASLASYVAMTHDVSMTPHLTARQAAEISGRSKSQIHRDALSGKLPIAQQYPGYNGPRMFDEEQVRRIYGVAS